LRSEAMWSPSTRGGGLWQSAGEASTVGTVTKSRLEAFSDGVLAIAITLLVIEIRPPEVREGERLTHALWAQWPSYFAYLVSFLTIGVIWLNHHRIFEQVARVDGPLLLLNLNLLLWTALIPFPTAVVAQHLGGAGEAARTASALYSGVLLLMGLAFGGPVRLGHPHRPPAAPAAATRGGASGPPAVHGRPGRLCRRLHSVVGVGAACPGLVWAHGALLRLRPGVGAGYRGAK
jgi:transmembrane protein TMEM174 (potassium channel)